MIYPLDTAFEIGRRQFSANPFNWTYYYRPILPIKASQKKTFKDIEWEMQSDISPVKLRLA